MTSETPIPSQAASSAGLLIDGALDNRALDNRKSGMRERLALLRRLEASLVRSHHALRALDLGAIDQETREQWSLSRTLQVQIQGEMPSTSDGALWRPPAKGAQRPENLEHGSELAQELFQCEHRVVQALRLQMALLRRAQQKLHVLRNTLSGSAMNYAGLVEESSRLVPTTGSTREAWI